MLLSNGKGTSSLSMEIMDIMIEYYDRMTRPVLVSALQKETV